MTKPDTYHRHLIGSEGIDSWQQVTYRDFVRARDEERVSGNDWCFETATHEYWVEGS